MRKVMKILWLFLFCVNLVPTKGNNAVCKDAQGNPVDWYYLYKLPKLHNGVENDGLRYMFATSEQPKTWQLAEVGINSTDSLPGKLLSSLYGHVDRIFIAYNDEIPAVRGDPVNESAGHTKGVLAVDAETAVWLIHSVPKFPKINEYEYPATGELYGQSFLCISLSLSEVEKVATQLLYNDPNIYYSWAPKDLMEKYPTLQKVVSQHARVKSSPYSSQLTITSIAGTKFQSFAKSGKFDGELYADFIAPQLKANLLVESWRKGPGDLNSSCETPQKVYNIKKIQNEDIALAFKSTDDHSKWAVTEATGFKIGCWRFFGNDWTCVGDINRQQHQLKRGGGSVCQESTIIADLYRRLVDEYEQCKSV